ncbi:MAG: PHP domain protein [Candidatus Levybacteria bacterium GW2011_GWA2_40_8]|nr:MAG: PHP domain protein [Candidatus Levybacteria bacterium GW2011_GWA2_40_8]
MQVVADLHLHSKYSRAVSKDMVLPIMAQMASKKGLDLLTTGDFTHPLWLREAKENLKEIEEGIYSLKQTANRLQTTAESSSRKAESKNETRFILSVEVSSIYSQDKKVRRVHSLLFAPNIETAEKINKELFKRGANLTSDGRPIVGLNPQNLLEIILSVDKSCFLIPCHVWTPWFSLYGSMSGFDSIDECFGELSDQIFAVETGLSSDPSMNWRIKELENRSIVSFSDAHSPMKMGREATVFVRKDGNSKSEARNPSFNYDDIRRALMQDSKAKLKIGYTIEFYPEEGKYHYTGHRNCNVSQSPDETKKKGTVCPVCKKPLTVGVMHRVEELAESPEDFESKPNSSGLIWNLDPRKLHPPFVKLVPLNEIIAEVIESPVGSPKVARIFGDLVEKFDSEMNALLKTSISEIEKVSGADIASAINKVRIGDLFIQPGYDGEYGIVKISKRKDVADVSKNIDLQNQLGLDI